MAIALTARLDNQVALGALAQARERGQDLKPALRVMGRAGVRQTQRRFETSTAPDGSIWKKGRKLTGKTLIASSLLMRSISDRPPGETYVEWGSNRVYARVHQLGFSGPVQVKAHYRIATQAFGKPLPKRVQFIVKAHTRKMDLPARPYLGANAADLAEFAQIGIRHLGEPLWIAL